MPTYRNIRFTTRNYECSNVVACVSPAPPNEFWIECEPEKLKGLTLLFCEGEISYYGYL